MSTAFGPNFIPLRPYIHWNYIDEVSVDKFPLLRTQ